MRWVQSQPCCIHGCTRGPSVNAHVSPEGDPSGMARKHDFTQIVPLCSEHHHEYHQLGQRSFNDRYGTDLDLLAIVVDLRWRDESEDMAI